MAQSIQTDCHTLKLSWGTRGNAPTAFMPAVARPHCILWAKRFEKNNVLTFLLSNLQNFESWSLRRAVQGIGLETDWTLGGWRGQGPP